MERPVPESWATITGWLKQHLPDAYDDLQPPSPSQSISAVRTAMDGRLPADLVAWLSLNNGIKPRSGFGNILPTLFNPMTCELMLRRREMLRGIYARWDRPGEQEYAGTRSLAWLDGFLPIGDAGTDVELFADLREGELHGCIGRYDAEAGGSFSPYWMSTTDMLSDVADALTLGRPVLQGYARRSNAANPSSTTCTYEPFLDEGTLYWTRFYPQD
ncbi:hypothetical protein ACIBL3_26585 [Kribbella sp. NPDC050124]|uniref:hypothetical protein n=1 Tax=Kribbella sp. NPDC050124 TaxID=3364114 RepID=UPI00378C1FF1